MSNLTCEALAPAMEAAVGEVFEAMAFTEAFGQVPVSGRFPGEEHVYCTRLPVFRPCPATVSLHMPAGLALRVAGNMLGRQLDLSGDESLVVDALGELANMLAGSFLTRILPAADGFELGLPECRGISDPAPGTAGEAGNVFHFATAGGHFLITWESNGYGR